MTKKKIDIRIDRLTVPAGSAGQKQRITAAMTQELERYVRRNGIPKHWIKRDKVWVPRVESRPGESPSRVGQSIARAIYRGEK